MAKTFIDEIIKLSSGLSDQQIADIIIGSNNWKDAMQPFMGIKSISQYQDSAELFIQSTLGYNIWSKQTEIIKSVEQNKNTVVSSGHSTGKSTIAALLTCWWLSTKENSVVVTLAPCYDNQTEVLTDCGWKFFSELDHTEKVACLNQDGTIKYEKPEDYYTFQYSGEMIGYKSQLIDFLVTPN